MSVGRCAIADNPQDGAPLWYGPPRPSLHAHPEPIGLGDADVESLSGYLQRVAAVNRLPVASLLAAIEWVRHKSACPTNPDLCPWDLAGLASLTRHPVATLEQMSLAPLYHVFYGARPAQPEAIRQFVASHGRGVLFTRSRRYCPDCLRDTLVFRLRWQFREVTVCLQHEALLAERCLACGQSSPVLATGSVFGRCLYCGLLLTRAAPRAAPRSLLEPQRVLQRDYDQLLAGRIRFAVPGHPEAGADGFFLRVEHIRTTRDLTWSRFAATCGVSFDVVRESMTKRASLGSFLHLARHLTGSLETFMHVPSRARASADSASRHSPAMSQPVVCRLPLPARHILQGLDLRVPDVWV